MSKHNLKAKQITGGGWVVERNGKPVSFHLYRADAQRKVREG